MSRWAMVGASFFLVAISCGPGVSLDPGAHVESSDGAPADAGADAGSGDSAPADVDADAGSGDDAPADVDAPADTGADAGPSDGAAVDVAADARPDRGPPPPLGVFTEFLIPTENALPGSIAAGNNGRVWFVEDGADKIAWLTPAPTIQEFMVTPGMGASGLVVDADENLWFSETNRHVIARMTPQGTLAESRVLDSKDEPTGLVFSHDGYLWFGLGAERVGRMVPAVDVSGSAIEFTFPGSATRTAFAFAVGIDNNVWFTEYDGNKIGNIDLSGDIVEYPIGTAGAAPSGITAGLDGKLWFVESVGNKVGSVDLQGHIEELSIPTPQARPTSVTVGGDGNLWFTESGTNCQGLDGASCLGRVTPDGTVTEVIVPSMNAKPLGIATDNYGNLWFTESGANKVGEYRLSSSPSP